MKKKYILFVFFIIIFCFLIGLNTESYAKDLDRIKNYVITVEPRMNDGTLDITYQITWKVLDSTTEGPLEWVQIGTPNSNFNNPVALTSNIKSIKKYNGSYVKIDFNKAYHAGEEFTFKYSIHQGSMHKKTLNNCNFTFTPAWFTGAEIDSMTIKWNKDQVKKEDSHTMSGSYLIWKKTNMEKGEKLTASITYDKSAFATLSSAELRDSTSSTTDTTTSILTNYNNSSNSNVTDSGIDILVILIIVVYVLIAILSMFGGGGGGGYYSHRGFYGSSYYGSRRYHSSCVSSCACASSCASSCACACAGSGRAGCSKKRFLWNKDKYEKNERENEKII